MTAASLLIRKPVRTQATFAEDVPALRFSYLKLISDTKFLRMWPFTFLNISCGLFLIPLAQQLMDLKEVGYSKSFSTAVLTVMGLMNGAGRFIFAWWSDRLTKRINILLIILAISFGVMLSSLLPILLAAAFVVISACYGAGFSTIPAVLADHYGMSDISKIHGAVLSEWGIAGLTGNQTALWIFKHYGLTGLSVALAALYMLNALNVLSLKKSISVRSNSTN
jgi:OFA family oxalate/formate antiporter-like MFS transporter